jgi:hypothetical protein
MNFEKLTKSEIRKVLTEADWACEGNTATAYWNDETLLTLFCNSDKMVVTSDTFFKAYEVGGLEEFEELFGLFDVGMC